MAFWPKVATLSSRSLQLGHLLFCLFFVSCGTLFQKNDIVSLDTDPRGVHIYSSGDKRFLGTTPFFLEMPQSSKGLYDVHYKNFKGITVSREFLLEQKESCGIQWTDPILENIPILNKVIPMLLEEPSKYIPIMPSLNLISGGRVDCSSQVTLTLADAAPLNPENSCQKFLIVPVPHSFKKISDRMALEWTKQVFDKEKKDCDEVIPPYKAEEFLAFLGLDNLSRYHGLKYMAQEVVAKIGLKFQNTHLVFFQYKDEEGKFQVTPEIFDVHTRQPVESPFQKPFSFSEKIGKTFKFEEFVTRTFQFIPNSFSLKFNVQKNIELEPEEEKRNFPTRDPKFDPIPGFHIGSIDYPYRIWNFVLRFSPSITMNTWDEKFSITAIPLTMAAKTAFHTPVGSLFFRIGWGLGYLAAKSDDGAYSHSEISPMVHIRYGYYIFVTKRIFLMFDANHVNVSDEAVQHQNFHLKRISTFRFQVGTFLPEMKTKIKEFLHRE